MEVFSTNQFRGCCNKSTLSIIPGSETQAPAPQATSSLNVSLDDANQITVQVKIPLIILTLRFTFNFTCGKSNSYQGASTQKT